MKKLVKSLKLNKQQFYETHISIVISVLPVKLTTKEIEVLACFMSLDEKMLKDRFGVAGKALVKERLELSAAGLSNYLKALKDKGFVSDKNGVLSIHPIIYTDSKEQEYNFKIAIEDEE